MYGVELSYSLFGWEITQNQNGDYVEKKSKFRQIFLPSCSAICDAICLVLYTRLPMGRNSSFYRPRHTLESTLSQISAKTSTAIETERMRNRGTQYSPKPSQSPRLRNMLGMLRKIYTIQRCCKEICF